MAARQPAYGSFRRNRIVIPGRYAAASLKTGTDSLGRPDAIIAAASEGHVIGSAFRLMHAACPGEEPWLSVK